MHIPLVKNSQVTSVISQWPWPSHCDPGWLRLGTWFSQSHLWKLTILYLYHHCLNNCSFHNFQSLKVPFPCFISLHICVSSFLSHLLSYSMGLRYSKTSFKNHLRIKILVFKQHIHKLIFQFYMSGYFTPIVRPPQYFIMTNCLQTHWWSYYWGIIVMHFSVVLLLFISCFCVSTCICKEQLTVALAMFVVFGLKKIGHMERNFFFKNILEM